jgi:hypothetical protein
LFFFVKEKSMHHMSCDVQRQQQHQRTDEKSESESLPEGS